MFVLPAVQGRGVGSDLSAPAGPNQCRSMKATTADAAEQVQISIQLVIFDGDGTLTQTQEEGHGAADGL
jgi:hypothetical protein